jgi:hypothetical protein
MIIDRKLSLVAVRTPLWVFELELPLPDLLGLIEATSKAGIWPKARHANTVTRLA